MLSNQQELLDRGDLTFQLMQNIFQIYELPLFEDEYAYLYSDFVDSDDQQDIVQETRAIIRCVSKKLAIDFTTDSQLFTNLFAHLSLRLGKKRVFANEYNPFVDDIKSEHRDLFAAIEEACKVIITGNPNLINDSFIAYIALHFLVFFERKEKENQAVHIVYICSTGLGVTSLIQQTVMEEIPNIEKVDFASILDANKTIKEKKPDIVVSIFPLEDINLPFVKVHALLTKEDIQAIKDAINNISKKSNTVKRKNKTLTQRNFQELKDVSQDLIVKGFVVYQSLIGVFRNNISNELKEAFLLHVFLMVQRIYFDGQYADEGHFNKEDFKERKADLQQIEKIFAENELSVNQAEIIALLQYINGGEETYGALNEGRRENH